MVRAVIAFTLLLITNSALASVISAQQCEELILKKYNRGMARIYSIEHRQTGRGKYATHYHYEIKYVRNWEKRYIQEGCIEKVYCTSYDDQIYTELKYCGK